ncbi:MAG: DegT/DnrJ/EryC1/StrS family aminotransferase [Patescibacteria group bacterium]|nr:DegT/DnrJ/EryC1/StrS family aminotransferase [Patescibacteria group bacterium]
MFGNDSINRRRFVAGASGTMMAGALSATAATAADASPDPAKLAIHDGPKAVQHSVTRAPRWGEPEREQLEAMLGQDTLFYWGGPQTKLFTERFREFCPLEHVHPCSSGTAAIHIAVATAGIGFGDEVITSPVTDIGSVIGVLYQGGVPVFADLGAGTYNLDVADVRRRITPKTKAIIAVHLTGNPCDVDALRALADEHKLVLIEDCCQAWGSRTRGRPIGTVGDFACFSLQNSKHITCGDGGVVATNNEAYGPMLQPFGDKGAARGARREGGGFRAFATNYRMSEPQAAVVAAQLTRLEGIAATRSRLGNLLTENIKDIAGIIPHEVHPEDRAVYWFYMFRIKPEAFRINRDDFARTLRAEGAPAGGGYIGVPLYGEPVFREHAFFAGRWPVKDFGQTDMDFSKHSCPEADAILKTGIRITIHEGMTDEYVLDVAKAIRKVAAHFAV